MIFLASILEQPVQGKSGEVIGKLDDLIVRLDQLYPTFSGLIVRDGRRRFFVPARHLQDLNGSSASVCSAPRCLPQGSFPWPRPT